MTDDPIPAIALRAVSRRHGSGDSAVTALDAVSLAFPRGSFTAVMGPSGSGKSTLLQCAAGLDRPTSGTVTVGGTELTGLSERRLTLLRRKRVGFVFQAFNLLPSLTAEQNVGLPLRLAGRRPSRARVREVLARVGLADRARHRPSELSGGQQQRVALARALITRPEVLFADEPTGALDSRTARTVLTLLRELTDAESQTIVMVTHDPVAASYADRVLFLVDGRVDGELTGAGADAIAAHLTHLETGTRPSGSPARAEAGSPARVGARSLAEAKADPPTQPRSSPGTGARTLTPAVRPSAARATRHDAALTTRPDKNPATRPGPALATGPGSAPTVEPRLTPPTGPIPGPQAGPKPAPTATPMATPTPAPLPTTQPTAHPTTPRREGTPC